MPLRMRTAVWVGLVFLAGCRPTAVGPAPAPHAEEPDAPKGDAIADPVLREARTEADTLLGGLIAAKFDHDPDLAPVARKVIGYQSFSVKSQTMSRVGTAEFWGVLGGPAGRARFDLTLVRQTDGRWAVGAFSGPNPE